MKAIVIAALVLLLNGCTSPMKYSFEPGAADSIRRIALVDPVEPEQYTAFNLGHPGMYLGLASGIVTGSHMEAEGKAFTAHLRQTGFDLGRRLAERTVHALERRGYEVVRVTSVADARGVDAVLTLTPMMVGYVAPRVLTDYIPAISVVAELVPAGRPEAEPVYRDGFLFGWQGFTGWWVPLPAPPEYSYRNFADLMKRSEEAADGLTLGADRIAERLAADFMLTRTAVDALTLNR
jgi:hypothetical protein